jgi:hypothetical protein
VDPTAGKAGDGHGLDDVPSSFPNAGSGTMNLARMESVLQADTTLFRAFRNLRFAGYRFTNELVFTGSDGEKPGIYHSVNRQYYRDSCRSMEIEKEWINDNFYSGNHKHRFWTARLYDSLFYTSTLTCGEPWFMPMIPDDPDKSLMDRYTDQLKIVVFRPGMETDLPFIGSKTAIFSDELRDYYRFEVGSGEHLGRTVHLFRATPRPQLTKKQMDQLAIQYLETGLDRDNLQVLYRKYHVKMSNWLFECDIRTTIDVQLRNGRYFPTRISYDGYWDIIGLDGERGRFEIVFSEFS